MSTQSQDFIKQRTVYAQFVVWLMLVTDNHVVYTTSIKRHAEVAYWMCSAAKYMYMNIVNKTNTHVSYIGATD
jgi:hypothetical protein